MVESDQRCIDHVVRRHHDLWGKALVREAGESPKIGCGRARQNGLDTDALVGEPALQSVAKRNDIGFGPAAHAVEAMPSTNGMLMIVPAPRATKASAAT
jgi:hypothetical protein